MTEEMQNLKRRMGEICYENNYLKEENSKLKIICDKYVLFIICLIKKYGIKNKIWLNKKSLSKVDPGTAFGAKEENGDIVFFLGEKGEENAPNL